jgi:hypothetical protein
MPDVTVVARIAGTAPMEKYGGVALDVRVLHQMATALNAGGLPMNFGHSPLEPIEVKNVQAAVVETEDGQQALDATFDVDADAWARVQERFDEAGVRGGFSFSAGEKQLGAASGEKPIVSLAADAAAFTDEDRAAAWRFLEQSGPAEVSRLYQFDAQEILRVIVDVWAIAGPFIVNVASSGIYDALKLLVQRHRDPTVIELREHRSDGGYSTAVIRTDDPEMLRTALDSLSGSPTGDLKRFDETAGRWQLPAETGGEEQRSRTQQDRG